MAKKKESTLTSWEDVNLQLKKLADLEIQKRTLENQETEETNKIKEKFMQQTNSVVDEINSIEKDIILFAEQNRSEFTKKRTKKLTFGTVSFRSTRKISVKNSTSAIASLKQMNMDEYIRKAESIDKEALLALSDNELAPLLKAGISVSRKDKITVEPDIVQIASDNQTAA